MMKLLGRKIDQKGSSDANLPFGSAFGWLQYTFTLTGNISNKNISVQKLGGGLPSRKLTAHHWQSMVGRWKFLLGWHVFGGSYWYWLQDHPVPERPLNPPNGTTLEVESLVGWVGNMTIRHRWRKMNEDEPHNYEYVSSLTNKNQRWTTRQNVSKVYRERFAISTQLQNLCLAPWLLQWSYFNLYHNLNSKVEFEKPFPSFSFEKAPT